MSLGACRNVYKVISMKITGYANRYYYFIMYAAHKILSVFQSILLHILILSWICDMLLASTAEDEQCDLNDDICFSLADPTNWTFNYVSTKQEYIELISRGKSGLTTLYREKEGLAHRDGVKVGHTEKVELDDGRTVDIITRAMRPLLFEIPGFLTDEECDHIIKRAKDPREGGMFESRVKGGLTPLDTFKPTGKKGKSSGIFGNFTAWDKNKDNSISIEEMIFFIHWRKNIIMLESDVREMFTILGTEHALEDALIHNDEFKNIDTLELEEYVDILLRNHIRFKERHSTQTWILMDQWLDSITHNIRQRLVNITGLDMEIILGGETLQVVHYTPHGHYHAHRDTETHEERHIPCCHQREYVESKVGQCRMCRYITVLFFLNHVEEGGETAFPIADEPKETPYDTLRGNSSTDKINLSHGCKRANLVLPPRKGTAIMWYNHLRNETDSWLGEIDLFSIHGGCDVIKGEKWISNMWINAPYGHTKEIPSIYLNWYNLHLTQYQSNILEV